MKYVAGGRALIPVGSRAVRDAITAYAPALSLLATSTRQGAVKIGRTLPSIPAARPRMACCKPRSSTSTRRRRGEALSADQRLNRVVPSDCWRDRSGWHLALRLRRCSSGTRRARQGGGPASTRSPYSFMSVNLVTLGMFYSLAVFAIRGIHPYCRSSSRGDRRHVPRHRLSA